MCTWYSVEIVVIEIVSGEPTKKVTGCKCLARARNLLFDVPQAVGGNLRITAVSSHLN